MITPDVIKSIPYEFADLPQNHETIIAWLFHSILRPAIVLTLFLIFLGKKNIIISIIICNYFFADFFYPAQLMYKTIQVKYGHLTPWSQYTTMSSIQLIFTFLLSIPYLMRNKRIKRLERYIWIQKHIYEIFYS